MRSWSARLRSVWMGLRALAKPVGSAVKVGFITAALIWLIPSIFVEAQIAHRLNANIYDFYGIIFLLWLSWKSYITEKKIDIIIERIDDRDKPIVLEIEDEAAKNLKRLKKKLDRRRKNEKRESEAPPKAD